MIKLNEYGIFGYTTFAMRSTATLEWCAYYCELREFDSQKRERNLLSRS